MNILQLVWDWRFAVIASVAFLIWVALDWNNAKVQLYQLMLVAKSKAKDAILKSGQEQEDWVVAKAWKYLPLRFKIFIKEETVRKIIKWLYRKAKDKIDDGQINNSI